MLPRRLVALVLTTAVALAACGSSGDSNTEAATASIDGSEVAVGAVPLPGDGVGSIGDAVEVAAGATGDAGDAACTVDHQTLQTAIDAYEMLNGALPTSQQDLLDAQMIRELSVRFEVSADGVIVQAPGSPCP
jgi:hypothetical protein